MTTSDARARMALSTADGEHRRLLALVEIVKEQWRAENERANRLQAEVDRLNQLREQA